VTPSGLEPGDFTDVSISPDGRQIAVTRGNIFTGLEIWINDVARESLTKLFADGGVNAYPLWTLDGKGIVYSSNQEGGRNLFRRPADGAGAPVRLTTSANQQSPWGWSHDGRILVLQELHADTSWDISQVSANGGRESVLIQTPGFDLNPAMSPDGRWLAYDSNEAGTPEVFVRPFPNVNDHRWQVSTGGGRQPKWSRDGKELFYRQGSSVMRLAIAPQPEFQPGAPERLFGGIYQTAGDKSWDVAPDGRFLFKKILPAEYSVNVVLNWFEELKQRVPIPH
jgi:serine/threonine-protein kinase